MKILFAASEAYPYIKTGGLGDVMYSLPAALTALGENVRLILPAYREVMQSITDSKVIASFNVLGAGVSHQVNILQVQESSGDGYLYLVDVPALFDREGNPYVNQLGHSWLDNAERYVVFNRAIAMFATQASDHGWRPDVVHCHDWQTGLVPAFLKQLHSQIQTVYTIHNLSYDGYFSHHEFTQLQLPVKWWSPEYVEFYGGFSMMKAGMVFANHVTTVSQTYAREICTPEFGHRYDGVLRHLGDKLSGILNGIDLKVWDPASDQHIAARYSVNRNRIAATQTNKRDLLTQIGLPVDDAPLLGFIGRLVAQKGIDLIMDMLPELFEKSSARVVVLGAGEKLFEQNLLALQKKYPDRLYVCIGYSEPLAHKIEAGSDIFLMPSRFEPCGLNQMYSLRYGTPPLVHHTGGLADTVVGVNEETLKNKSANGFVCHSSDAETLLATTLTALTYFDRPRLWQQICRTAMLKDLGWDLSAKQYQKLYKANVEAMV